MSYGLLALHHGLSGLDYAIVVGYMAVMLGMGVYFSGRQTSSEEYFVGRRSLPPLVVGLSIVATLLSTITYLAAPGDMIQHGLAFATSILSVPLWLVIVLRYWVPFFMRYRLTSVYEYAGMRFNQATRWLSASLFILMRFGWMGMIIYTATGAVAQMTADAPQRIGAWTGVELTPPQYFYALLIGMGLIATFYTFLGGIRVVIWTDAVQFVVMVGGAVFAIGYIWYATERGPLAWWHDATRLQRAAPVWFGWQASGTRPAWLAWMTSQRTVFFVVLNAFFWRICTHCSDQVATQRYFSTAGVRQALRSNVVSAVGDFALVATLGLVGLALLSFYTRSSVVAATASETSGEWNPAALTAFAGGFDPTNADHAKDAYPIFIVEYMPAGLAGLIMAALFAAAMSSIDSGINSISAVVTTDFYRVAASEGASPQTEMRVARWTTLATGVAITLVAFLITAVIAADPQNRNLVDLSIRVFNLFLGPLAAIFIAGIFFPWVGSAAIIAACIFGSGFSVLLSFWGPLFAALAATFPSLEGLAAAAPSPLLVTPLSTTLTVFAAALLGGLLPSPSPASTMGHTWWTRHLLPEAETLGNAD